VVKKILSISILIIFGVWVTRYVLQHQGDFQRLDQVEAVHVVVLALINIVLVFNNGYFLKTCLAKFDIHLSLSEHFSISNFSTFLNYISPFRGGLGFRALYLKTKHGVDFGRFTSIVAGTTILYFFITSVLGLLCVVIVYVLFGLLDYVTLAAFVALFGGFAYFIFFAPTIGATKYSRLNKLLQLIGQWDELRSDPRLLRRLVVITINNLLFATALSWIAFKSIGHALNFFVVMYITVVTALAALVGITPGAVGILEATMLFIGNQLNVSSSDILLVALINRSSAVIVSTVLAPLSGYILWGRQRRSLKSME